MHPIAHSGYFTRDFVQTYWVPIIRDDKVNTTRYDLRTLRNPALLLLADYFPVKSIIAAIAVIYLIFAMIIPIYSRIVDMQPALHAENTIEEALTRGQLKFIQSRLCVEENGDFGADGSETREAIRDYQKSENEDPSGRLTIGDKDKISKYRFSCAQLGLYHGNSFERFFYPSRFSIEKLHQQLSKIVKGLQQPDQKLLTIVQAPSFNDRGIFDSDTRAVIAGLQRLYGFVPPTPIGKMTEEFRDKLAQVSSAVPTVQNGSVAWGGVVSPEFLTKVKSICFELSCDPSQLMAVMAFETEETFSPSITNNSSGSVGLLQFLPGTAMAVGTTTSDLAKMSAVAQLDFVQKYLERFGDELAL